MWGLKTILCLVLAAFPAGIFSTTVLNLAELPQEIPSESHPFWSSHGKNVQVRGFWHPISDEEGILTPLPNVKSCCLRAPGKVLQQIVVRGRLPQMTSLNVVTVEGILKIEPLFNKEDELIQLYVLNQAKEAQTEKSYAWSVIVVGLLASAFMTLFYQYKRG